MLRVGLTGGVGSGKSAVAAVWAVEGVPVRSADELGRALMQPGEAVYRQIVEAFGPEVVGLDGALDRGALARAAFIGGRLEELNGMVHPAVIAAQEERLRALEVGGEHPLAVVESALIFEASGQDGDERGATAPGWRKRFGRLVLVAAPEALRVERFIARAGGGEASENERARLREDAQRRMAAQLPDDWKRARCDYVIENTSTLVLLRREALRVLAALRRYAADGAAAPVPFRE